MSDELLSQVQDVVVKGWNRSTVADGIWLQQNTISKLEARDEIIASYIDNNFGPIKTDAVNAKTMADAATAAVALKQDKITASSPLYLDGQNNIGIFYDSSTLIVKNGLLTVKNSGGAGYGKLTYNNKSNSSAGDTTVDISGWDGTMFVTGGDGIKIDTAQPSSNIPWTLSTTDWEKLKTYETGSVSLIYDSKCNKLYYKGANTAQFGNVWADNARMPSQTSKLLVLDDFSVGDYAYFCKDECDVDYRPYFTEQYYTYFIYNKKEETLYYWQKMGGSKGTSSRFVGSTERVLESSTYLPGGTPIAGEGGKLIITDEEAIAAFKAADINYEFSYYCKDEVAVYTLSTEGSGESITYYWTKYAYHDKTFIVNSTSDIPASTDFSCAYYCKEDNKIYSFGLYGRSTTSSPWAAEATDMSAASKRLRAEVVLATDENDTNISGLDFDNGALKVKTDDKTTTVNSDNELVVNYDTKTLTVDSYNKLAVRLSANNGLENKFSSGSAQSGPIYTGIGVKVDDTTIKINSNGALEATGSNKFGNAVISIAGKNAVGNCYINNNNTPSSSLNTQVYGTSTIFYDHGTAPMHSRPVMDVMSSDILTKCIEQGVNNLIVRYDTAYVHSEVLDIDAWVKDGKIQDGNILDLSIDAEKLDKYKMYTVNLVPLYQQAISNTGISVDINDDMNDPDENLQGMCQYSISFKGNHPIDYSTSDYACKTYGFLYNVPAFGENHRDGYKIYWDQNGTEQMRYFMPRFSHNSDITNECWQIYGNDSTRRKFGYTSVSMQTIQPHSELSLYTPNDVNTTDVNDCTGGMIKQLGCDKFPCITMEFSQPYDTQNYEYTDNHSLYVYQRQISFMRGDDIPGPQSETTNYNLTKLNTDLQYSYTTTSWMNFILLDNNYKATASTGKISGCGGLDSYNLYKNNNELLRYLIVNTDGASFTTAGNLRARLKLFITNYLMAKAKQQLIASGEKNVKIGGCTITTEDNDYLASAYGTVGAGFNLFSDSTNGKQGSTVVGARLVENATISANISYTSDDKTSITTYTISVATPSTFNWNRQTVPSSNNKIYANMLSGTTYKICAFVTTQNKYEEIKVDSPTPPTSVKNMPAYFINWIRTVNSSSFTTQAQLESALQTSIQNVYTHNETVSNVHLGNIDRSDTTKSMFLTYTIKTVDQSSIKAYTIYFFTQASY